MRLSIFLFFLSLNIFSKTYEVNGQHSFVNFELDYMKVSEVKGTFDRFTGAFEWNEEKSKLSNVEFEIFVKSINTRDPKRDNHLKRKDFFDVKKYPYMTFVGKKVAYKNGLPVSIMGELTLKDRTKPHKFEIDWKGEYPDPVDKNKKSLFLKAKTIINRTDFGITWNRALDQGGWIVGEDVEVEIVIEGNPTDARPAFSRFYRKKTKLLPGKLELPKDPVQNTSLNQEAKKKL